MSLFKKKTLMMASRKRRIDDDNDDDSAPQPGPSTGGSAPKRSAILPIPNYDGFDNSPHPDTVKMAMNDNPGGQVLGTKHCDRDPDPCSSEPPAKKIKQYDVKKMSDIIQCLNSCTTQKNIKFKNDLKDKLVRLHTTDAPVESLITDADLIDIITHFVSSFTTYAKCRPLFKSLCQEDQIALLSANATLFIQYIFAKYFTTTNGKI